MFRIRKISQYPLLIYSSWLWSNSGKECFRIYLLLQNRFHPIEMSFFGNVLERVKGILLPPILSLQVCFSCSVNIGAVLIFFFPSNSYTRSNFLCHIKCALLPIIKALRNFCHHILTNIQSNIKEEFVNSSIKAG